MRKQQPAASGNPLFRKLGSEAAPRKKRAPDAAVPAAPPKRAATNPRTQRLAPARIYHPGPLIDCIATLQLGVDALLAKDDSLLAMMLEQGGPPPLRLLEPGFAGLVGIIISQQVSVASAQAIAARVRAGIVPLEPAALLGVDDAGMRACGLSMPKIVALRALATALHEGTLALDALAGMAPEEAHRALVAVKGIGPWTADVFLLLCLGHPDAWPVGDIALQEAARLALKLKVRPDARALEKIGERWRPWRGVAARILWSYYAVAKKREGFTLPVP